MSNWENAAYVVENVYGGFVNWDEKYFICPDCGEPIYYEDWEDWFEGHTYFCPVCNYYFDN